jgi:hyperpolarization activated cyclic nucleotide-gated potassium channel 2
LVASVPFFLSASPEFVTEVVSHLRFEVYLPGDLIVKAGTIGERMYFLQEGIVSVLSEGGDLVTSLSEGSYFGGKAIVQT